MKKFIVAAIAASMALPVYAADLGGRVLNIGSDTTSSPPLPFIKYNKKNMLNNYSLSSPPIGPPIRTITPVIRTLASLKVATDSIHYLKKLNLNLRGFETDFGKCLFKEEFNTLAKRTTKIVNIIKYIATMGYGMKGLKVLSAK